MNCWKCKKNLGQLDLKIGFRTACEYCSSDLHVCKNCRYYSPGKPNDCSIPETDPIRDREAANFCESFKQGVISEKPNTTTKDFNSLFKKNE
jgi:hypothetical protein